MVYGPGNARYATVSNGQTELRMDKVFLHAPISLRGSVVNRNLFAERLQVAIEQQGLTYEEAARRIRQFLPQSSRLSGVSIWQYANGKAFPRRRSLLQAIGRALDLDVSDIISEGNSPRSLQVHTGAIKHGGARITDQCDGYANIILSCCVSWSDAIKIIDSLTGSEEIEEQETEA